jgi:hypothetical protein
MALALYHNDMSICSQKVRLVLAEKGRDWESRHLNLSAGDHQQKWYIKLNRARWCRWSTARLSCQNRTSSTNISTSAFPIRCRQLELAIFLNHKLELAYA